jgi:hypothetical protein
VITHHCHECCKEVEEVCDEHPNAPADSIVHGSCVTLTGETITDEQIRKLQRTAKSYADGDPSFVIRTCKRALGRKVAYVNKEAAMTASGRRALARERCAEILNARNGAKS